MKPQRRRAPLPPVRVRRDPPTLTEAILAAQGLSDEVEQQVEIAAGLMGVSEDEVRPLMPHVKLTPGSLSFAPFASASRSLDGGARVVVLKRRTVR
ncbi:MAG TPA: hypothetical protein VF601_03455 [Beijerinckiaceae bacterium]